MKRGERGTIRALFLSILPAAITLAPIESASAHSGSCTWSFDTHYDPAFNLVSWQAIVGCSTNHYKWQGSSAGNTRATAWLQYRESTGQPWVQFTGLHEPDNEFNTSVFPSPAWHEEAFCGPGTDTNDDFRIHIHNLRIFQPQGTLNHSFGDGVAGAPNKNSQIFTLDQCNGVPHSPITAPH